MPKKDVSDTVRGMLSSAGATALLVEPPVDDLPSAPPAAAEELPPPAPPAPVTPEAPPRSLHQPPAAPAAVSQPAAPRTLRLRASTADRVRTAWLEAKRDDVLLTAQDFASDLMEDALAARGRKRTRSAS